MNRVLLDTHVLLWLLTDDPALGAGARADLRTATTVLASTASLWELAIKHSVGKFPEPAPVVPAVERAGLTWLPVVPEHALRVRTSPLDHRDPFDRLLVAQAQTESCVLLTADERVLAAELADVRDARS